jgi:mono/diheme cytochrome c family protein
MTGVDDRLHADRESGEPPLRRSDDDVTPVVDLHEPIYREMAEPEDGYEPTPTWLLFLCLALVGFGGWYLGTFSGGFDPSVFDERARATGAKAVVKEAAPVDPMVLGARVYNNCMACHQRDGSGVAGNYPPLAESEWVQGRAEVLAALVLHGLEGPITVRGASYNQVMPAWSHLTDEQIAAVLTYVRASFGNAAPAVAPELVAAVRDREAGRTAPFTGQALAAYALTTAEPEVAGDGSQSVAG